MSKETTDVTNYLPILLARVMSNEVITDAFLAGFARRDGESRAPSSEKVDSRSSRENAESEGTSFHTDVANVVDCNLFQKKGRNRLAGSALRGFPGPVAGGGGGGGGGGGMGPLPGAAKGGGGGGGGGGGSRNDGIESLLDIDEGGGDGGRGGGPEPSIVVSEGTRDGGGELLLLIAIIGVTLGCGGSAREGDCGSFDAGGLCSGGGGGGGGDCGRGDCDKEAPEGGEDVSSDKIAEITTCLTLGGRSGGGGGGETCALKSFSVMNFGLAAN